MSILDDAIREHLELKRAHGADEAEVKRLEDEAFGPPQRPDQADPFAEAPTEFLLSPTEDAADVPEIGDEASRSGRRPNITDLQEPPTGPAFFDVEQVEDEASPVPADAAPPAPLEDELAPAPDAPPPSPADAADLPLPPPPGEAPPEPEAAAPQAPAPAEEPDAVAPPAAEVEAAPAEEQPAGEHQIVPDAGPNTEERHAIADQPTQMFDVQAHVDAEADVEAPAPRVEQESPSDEELVDAAQGEPQVAPPAPEDPAAAGPPTEIHEIPAQEPLDTRGPDAEVAGHPPTEEESTEYDFFNEQRLSDELDQALEAPLPPTDEHIAMPRYEDAPPPAQGAIFDFESSEEAEPAPGGLEPASEELETASEEYEPASEEYEPPSEEAPRAAAEPPSEEEPAYFDPDTGHEDVLEDKPKFLEDPDDDDLWFEQKPPKDFDLD